MANKFNILIGVSVLFILALLVLFIAQPLILGEKNAEWHFYARLFIVMFAINTFAQLRLYNAIVQNTRFAIKLREAIVKFMQVIPSLERSMKNLNSTMGNVKASSDNLRKSIDSSHDQTEELTARITNIKQFKN